MEATDPKIAPDLVALPPMDQISFRSHISIALCFPLVPGADVAEAIECLRDAVKAVVANHPFLGGQVVVDNQACKVSLSLPTASDIELQFRNQNDVPDMPASYAELKSQGFPNAAFEEPQLMDVTTADGGGPVLHVRYTALDGGLILWCYLHHALADGACIQMFLERLARKTCSQTRHESHPMHLWPEKGHLAYLCVAKSKPGNPLTKDQLRSHLDRCPDYGATDFDNGKIVRGVRMNPHGPTTASLQGHHDTKMFVFKTDRLKELCRTIQQEGGLTKAPSSHVALAALTWSQATKARLAVRSEKHGNSGVAKLCMPVNWRSRAFKDETEGFWGNTTINLMATAPTELILQAADDPKQLSKITTLIDKALREVNTDFISDRMRLMAEVDPRHAFVTLDMTDIGQFAFNTWRHFAADIEWRIPGVDGRKPDAVRKFQKGPTDGGILVLPALKDSGELEVTVPLKASVLGALCAQREWTRWVNRVVG